MGCSAVFAAADGRVVRWRAGAIVEDQVPLLGNDEVIAVVVDASGTIYAIGREHALYERGNSRWWIYPYPTRMRPLAAASQPRRAAFTSSDATACWCGSWTASGTAR